LLWFIENERKQAYGRLGFYYSCHAVCGIALFIIGTVSLSQLTNDSCWNTSYWYQIYYGAYIVVQTERRKLDVKLFYFLALNIKEIYINWLKALCKLKYRFVLKNKNGNRKVDLKKIQWSPKFYTLLKEGLTEVSKQLTLMHVALKRQNHL
jgi:hypothetical protein